MLNPRKVFWKRGTCSNAMFHLLNNEFDNTKPFEEKASDMLAGGIVQKGHQCGMLWGGALAVGTESFRRYSDMNVAIARAINASRHLVDSFQKRTGTANCRAITKVDWENKRDRTFYMLKIFAQGLVFSHCYNLMVKWTPEAINAADKGLSENIEFKSPCLSCSTVVVKAMGASDEESMMVAGFAGGIGLSGNACGALAAAIWYKMLDWGKKNPGQSSLLFDNPDARKVLIAFEKQAGSEMRCSKICNRTFSTIDDHSSYIKSGGCKDLLETLSKS